MNGDLEEAVRMLAADNCRLIDIALAADKLADAVADAVLKTPAERRALDAYRVVRNGQ